jgi:ParB family chromosome partitioning protein
MKMDSQELASVHAAGVRADIPYAQLRLSQTYQARRPGDAKDDPEVLALKATIAAVGGLLHNLVVVAMPGGGYEVCAGGRRFAAVGLLIDEGIFLPTYAVPCFVIPAEHAHHASLIENVARKAMHPADVYKSYARLRADGMTVDAIAAAHGADEKAVKKLLALGGVSPALMQLFRDDKIELAEMQALASVADHARQEAAWKAAKQGYWHRPSKIRELLAETEMRGDSAAARYVTVAAYEKAGGLVRRDLFQNDAYLDNSEMVREMALAKMQRSKLARAVGGEGWGWVECRVSFEQADRKRFGEIQRVHHEPDKAQEKQIAALEKKCADIEVKALALEQAEDCDEAELAKLEEKLQGWRDALGEIRRALYDFPADLRPLAGVVLYLDHNANLAVSRGLIRQEDREAVAALIRSTAKEAGGENVRVDMPPVKTRPVHSEGLVNRLQAQRVIALQAEIIQRPNLALCLLIEQLLGEVGDAMDRAYLVRSFDLSATSAAHDLERTDPDMEGSPAWDAVQREAALIMGGVPAERDAVLPWLLAQPQDENIKLLAALMSQTVYRVRYNNAPQRIHLDRLAGLVGLDMAKWWTPTVRTYLGHVSKDRIAAVVAEAVSEGEAKPLLAMKKAEAAATAERLLAGKGWVPDLMRGPGSSPDSVGPAGEAHDDHPSDDEGDDQGDDE